jgi:phosphopantothenoylcysteine synthetase/decarboxylase
MITIIIIFLVANTTTATTAAAASGTATTTTTTTSSALKKKVNVEKEHSKSMLQHVKNIRSEKQLNQMLGTLYIHLMDG